LEIAPDIYAIIPFHHTNERIFDEITRVKGSFSQTLCGVKNLIRYNVPELLLKVVILQQNYRDLENIVNLCNSLGLKRINFTFIEGGGNAKINWFKIAPHYSDIEQPLQKAIVLSKKKGIIVECYDIPFCFLKGHEECVSETNHYISPYLKGDSLERLSLKKENVIKDIVLSKRRKTKACAGCRFFDVCLGVWEEYLDYYGDGEFAPVLGKRVSGLNELINLQ
jgi:MoaA/NifB/PqqE/SkfB family radical SAM enzyme